MTGTALISIERGYCLGFLSDPDNTSVDCTEPIIGSGWLQIGDSWHEVDACEHHSAQLLFGGRAPKGGSPPWHHHIVSAGYQRLFAAGEQITYVDRSTHSGRPVSVRDAFKEKNFNSWDRGRLTDPIFGLAQPPQGPAWDSTLEEDWAELERLAFPAMRRISDSLEHPGDRWRVAQITALHLTRSYAFEKFFVDSSIPALYNFSLFMCNKQDFVKDFHRQYGRDPRVEDVLPTLEVFHQARWTFVSEMRHQFVRYLELFYRRGCSILTCPPGQTLAFSDNPVVSYADAEHLSLGDEPTSESMSFSMPISRTKAIWIHRRPDYGDGVLAIEDCQRLNQLQWSGAKRFVACHPDDDPSILFHRPISISKRRDIAGR